MIQLSEEQHRALVSGVEMPPTVIDPQTQEIYVLLRSVVYERIRHLIHDDTGLSKREVASLVERAMREYDANDPSLELYQHD